MKKLHLVTAFTLFFTLQAEAKRTGFAAQFSLIPEEEAHLEIGRGYQHGFNPRSIKTMVWNIKKGQEKGLDKDLPFYGKDRDLFILSEGYLSPLVKGTFESFQDIKWDMGISFLYKKDHNYPTGTMIGSKVEPFEVKIKHTTDMEPFIITPKALTFAYYPVEGKSEELLVISVHAINMVTTPAFIRQMEQARVEIERHNGPVIFAGDFNTNLKSKLKYLLKMTSDLGFQSVDFKNDDRKKTLGKIIDYTFVRGMHPKNSYVLGSLKSSDHYAMMVEFAID